MEATSRDNIIEDLKIITKSEMVRSNYPGNFKVTLTNDILMDFGEHKKIISELLKIGARKIKEEEDISKGKVYLIFDI